MEISNEEELLIFRNRLYTDGKLDENKLIEFLSKIDRRTKELWESDQKRNWTFI